MSNPEWEYWQAVKWIRRYLKGTRSLRLCFEQSRLAIEGYVTPIIRVIKKTRKSTTNYICTISSGTVSWISQLQNIIVLSSTEAEYVALTEAVKEMFGVEDFAWTI